MFFIRPHAWILVFVCLILCSTAIMAVDADASSPEARAAKAKAVVKKPATPNPKPAVKAAAKAPTAIKKPASAKPVVKAPAKPATKAPVIKKPVAVKSAPKPVTKAPVAIKKPVAAAKPVVKAKPVVNKKPVSVKPVVKAPVKPVTKTPTAVKKPVAIKPVSKVPTKSTVKPSVKPIAKAPVKASAAAPAASGALVCVKPKRRAEVRAVVGGKVPDQFIVHLKPGVNRAKHLATLKTLIAQGAKCDRTKSAITLDGAFPEKLSLYGGTFGPSVIAALKKSPDVKSVVGNTLLQVDSPIPITPEANVTKRAFLFDTTQTNSWSLARLNTKARTVTAAIAQEDATRNRGTRNWPFKNIRNAGKNVNVYIIDTGVSDHSDLTGRITRRPRANVAVAVDSPDADNTNDAQGHGTKMAGIIAGKTCGVAKFATIIPVKASQGNTGTITQMDVMAGLAFAANDAKGKGSVINISVTMRKNQNDGLPEMINSVIAAGMHIVNSAGNGGINDCAARIGTTDGPITVGNVGIDDVKAFTSNFGPCLTVFAPGNDIQTTAHNNPTGFISGSGTSEATAHTSGLVATLLSDSKLSPAAMKQKVVSLSVQVPTISAAGTTNRLIQVPS
ncbi:peptidase S8/S53 domain-containing protein [Mycena capillaripes]|nr:peptidase S8/S53 domain-containing protein [Mycena capillaripes]